MFVLYLIYDIVEYTTVYVYRNDPALIEDVEENLLNDDIDYQKYVAADFVECAHLLTQFDAEYDISICDFTGEYFDDSGFHKW